MGGASPNGFTVLPLLLDSRQVARLLGIGRTKTFQLMSQRQLPTVHIGRCVRVPRSALIGWVESQTETGLDGRYPGQGA